MNAITLLIALAAGNAITAVLPGADADSIVTALDRTLFQALALFLYTGLQPKPPVDRG